MRKLGLFVCAILTTLVVPVMAFAEGAAEGSGGSNAGLIAIAAGLTIALAALGGTSGQSRAISAGLDSIGRNPAASGKIFTPMIVGLVLIESLVILSFVIAYKLAGLV